MMKTCSASSSTQYYSNKRNVSSYHQDRFLLWNFGCTINLTIQGGRLDSEKVYILRLINIFRIYLKGGYRLEYFSHLCNHVLFSIFSPHLLLQIQIHFLQTYHLLKLSIILNGIGATMCSQKLYFLKYIMQNIIICIVKILCCISMHMTFYFQGRFPIKIWTKNCR